MSAVFGGVGSVLLHKLWTGEQGPRKIQIQSQSYWQSPLISTNSTSWRLVSAWKQGFKKYTESMERNAIENTTDYWLWVGRYSNLDRCCTIKELQGLAHQPYWHNSSMRCLSHIPSSPGLSASPQLPPNSVQSIRLPLLEWQTPVGKIQFAKLQHRNILRKPIAMIMEKVQI